MTPDLGFWRERRVLVTGGASFIGSHLVERLLAAGAVVHVADDLSSGRLDNLAAVIRDIDFREGDLRDPHCADAACEGVQAVFHLAASHGGRGYIDTHPVECASNMVLDGTVFAAAHRSGVEHICFASSACVYPISAQSGSGEGAVSYLRESLVDSSDPAAAAPDGEYGWAKLMGELALNAYHRQYGVKGVSCRLFTAYGERENETHAVIALIAKAFLRNDPYVIWGTGEQDRNFTYVSDIVEGLLRASQHVEDGSAVNIGTDQHVKVKDLALRILAITGFEPERIEFDKTKPVGVFSRAADLARSRNVLDWTPGTELDAGLSRTIDWYFETHDRDAVRSSLGVALRER